MDMENQMHKSNELTQECNRCQKHIADFQCVDCQNTFYCFNCDSYVHSLSTKRFHCRREVNKINANNTCINRDSVNKPKENKDTGLNATEKYDLPLSNSSKISPKYSPSTSPNQQKNQTYQRYSSPSQNNSNNDGTVKVLNNANNLNRTRSPCREINPRSCSPCTVSQSYLNDVKQIYEEEKDNLLNTINNLNKQLANSTVSLNERIEFLHAHIDKMNEQHMDEMLENEKAQTCHYEAILAEKEQQIAFLYDKIHQMEDISLKQRAAIDDCEDMIKRNQTSFDEKNVKAQMLLEDSIKENLSNKEFYEQRISDITKQNEENINRMIASYEKTIEQLKDGYETSKLHYLAVIDQKEAELKELKAVTTKEKIELNEILTKTKECCDKTMKDKEELLLLNSTLTKSLNGASDKVEDQKNDLKILAEDNDALIGEIDLLKASINANSEKQEKLNRLMYGRFSTKKLVK